jgi:hypothetical protein
MGQPINVDELAAAWRALGDGEGSGWRTIPVASGSPCPILAGRHFPGNHEALVLGFKAVAPTEPFPAGKGFAVAEARITTGQPDLKWFALTRQPSGSLELFVKVTTDVIDLIRRHNGVNDSRLLQVFIRRIRAWQSFMERSSDGLLSAESELGLVGELLVLESLIEKGVAHERAVEAWLGPLDGLHDFQFRTGAIEVKATVTAGSFRARIGSLEQLEDSSLGPLFLAAVRMELTESGTALPELVERIRGLLSSEAAALTAFEDRLIHAHFLTSHAALYTRRFRTLTIRILSVNDRFPRITRATVPEAVLNARYKLDLDRVVGFDVTQDTVLATLGA